jgi:hypothetical protein
MRLRLSACILLLASTTLQAQWLDWKTPVVPRTANGKPNLQAPVPRTREGRVDMSGVWVSDGRATGSLFDNSKIQGWALKAMLKQEKNFFINDPRFHCLPSGPGAYPAGATAGGQRRMIQHPDFIAILNPEMTYRQVYMDGRKLEDEPAISTWLGYSAGHWDGDTLVIESNGYNDKTWLTREGLPHTERLRITERYRRIDFGHIELTVTYDDPGTFTEPVQATIHLVNQPDEGMLETICNESAAGQKHYSGEISKSESEKVRVPLATLQKYVGTYQGLWLGNLITAEITLANGGIVLTRTPRYSDTGGNTNSARSQLVPRSQTAFDCACGLGFEFTVGADGVATEVLEVHVSGAWPFKRIR